MPISSPYKTAKFHPLSAISLPYFSAADGWNSRGNLMPAARMDIEIMERFRVKVRKSAFPFPADYALIGPNPGMTPSGA